jgi:predicted RNA binding protein YcfA (HicA-like mRNA interferase family)
MDAQSLVKALGRLGYSVTRQTGSHIRLTATAPRQHHVTVPNYSPIKVGTLNTIITEIATRLHLPKDELARRIFNC